MRFFLGTQYPAWLEGMDVPLFVSARRLRRRRALPRATCDWALDSGGFSELSIKGYWSVTEPQYARQVRIWSEEIGRLQWCAIMDWMCEPHVLLATNLSLIEHQRRTVASYSFLMDLAPDLPWVPVLQGWERDDYLRCLNLYAAAGHDLTALPLVGLGSVCRRQGTGMAEMLIRELAGMGLRLHAFGFKTAGLRRVSDALTSSDSMAWSYCARRRPPLPGCDHPHCNNCRRYALRWQSRLLARLEGPQQLALPFWGVLP